MLPACKLKFCVLTNLNRENVFSIDVDFVAICGSHNTVISNYDDMARFLTRFQRR